MTTIQPNPIIRIPQIRMAGDIDTALPLEHTQVTVQITGPAALVVVTQRFSNPLRDPAELDYLFPLPEDAAITSFLLQVGQRNIVGDLQEREAARTTYAEALHSGKHAGLLEQRRPNLFAVRLANVKPGETIFSTVRYQQRLHFSDSPESGGTYEFVFPMGLTPKYDSPQHPAEGEGVHSPVALDEKIGPVEIDVSVDAGFAVQAVSSPSHLLETLWLDGVESGRRFQAHLAGVYIPDHDFVLRYSLATGQAGAAGWASSEAHTDGHFLATLMPPLLQDDPEPLPREFIFVLDRSGSMSGQPIRQARNALRACLRALNPQDTFTILLFDNQLEWYQREPVLVTQEQIDLADSFLRTVEGRGGTEIVAALGSALALPDAPNRMRMVVFLTDGAVSVEARLLEEVRKKIGRSRIFTFGIGPSVNRALLSRMAAAGRGRAQFLQLDDDIEGAIIRFQDSVSYPALTDLSIAWEQGNVWDIYPATLPDLYYGQPLEISGRLALSGQGPLRITVNGMRAGQPVRMTLDIAGGAGKDVLVERLWAQARADDLMEQMEITPEHAEKVRGELIKLALEYHLVTPWTSFVGVDQSAEVVNARVQVIHVAQPLPQGLQPGGFGLQRRMKVHMAAEEMPSEFAMPAAFAPSAPTPTQQGAASQPEPFGSGKVMASRSLKSAAQQARDKLLRSVKEHGTQLEPVPAEGSQAVLRWLARSQNLNGSWRDDVEWTAAGLLAFLRAGQTAHVGIFRHVIRRAVQWLIDNPGNRPNWFLRAYALKELVSAGADEKIHLAAEQASDALPAPANPLEEATAGNPIDPLVEIRTLDDLRIASILRAGLPVPDALLHGPNSDLARLWAAAMAR